MKDNFLKKFDNIFSTNEDDTMKMEDSNLNMDFIKMLEKIKTDDFKLKNDE